MFLRALLLTVAAFAAGGHIAKADQRWTAGDLVCDPARNVALARFTMYWNEDPPVYSQIPSNIDGGLSSQSGTGRRVCKLSNGWEVRLRTGSEQAFGYGAGGASPPHFFSLWVNHRKVVSHRTWLPGYEASFDDIAPIAAVMLTPQTITTCVGTEPNVQCKSERLDLSNAQEDRVEYPSGGQPQQPAGTMTLPVGADNMLCRALVRRGRWADVNWSTAIVSFMQAPELQPDVPEFDWIDTSALTPVDVASWASINSQKLGELDIDGDGKHETVIRIHGTSHAFDGTYWIALAHGTELSAIENNLFIDPSVRDRPKLEAEKWFVYSAAKPGLYPNVLADFVHLDPYTHDGQVYLLAHPTHQRHDPTAMLIKPRPKGQFEIKCIFQLVRPNF